MKRPEKQRSSGFASDQRGEDIGRRLPVGWVAGSVLLSEFGLVSGRGVPPAGWLSALPLAWAIWAASGD